MDSCTVVGDAARLLWPLKTSRSGLKIKGRTGDRGQAQCPARGGTPRFARGGRVVSNTGGRRTADGEEGSSGQCLRLERALATNKWQPWACCGSEAGGRGPRTWAARSGPATPAQDAGFFFFVYFCHARVPICQQTDHLDRSSNGRGDFSAILNINGLGLALTEHWKPAGCQHQVTRRRLTVVVSATLGAATPDRSGDLGTSKVVGWDDGQLTAWALKRSEESHDDTATQRCLAASRLRTTGAIAVSR